MLRFDRSLPPTPQPIPAAQPFLLKNVDLNGLLQDHEENYKLILGPSINLRYSLASNPTPIEGDIEPLEQLIEIFLVNAKKAMPHGGQLLIQTREVVMPDTEGFSNGPASTSYLMLAISDSGNGLLPEIQTKIQHLFSGRWHPGAGILPDLVKAKTILDQHHARLLMYSQTVRGTSFKIYFPLKKQQDIRINPTAPKGTETLLFVEDDPIIRNIYIKFLRQRGYNVLEAQHGKEAYNVYESYKGNIHLMVTDVVMPELNGRQLVDMVSVRHPRPKVLYISGFTKDAIVQRGILKADMPFLEKPFGREELALRIRQLLDTTS
jgi:two-component system cell cycle sensor histidine kinase/response regulator CckA